VAGTDQIVSLTAGQVEADRVTEGIDQCVDLGAQSAARAPDRLVLACSYWRGRYADGGLARVPPSESLVEWPDEECTMMLSIIAYSLSTSAARC
jgi:hypothetical protein